MSIPVRCLRCGHVALSRRIAIRDSRNVTLDQIWESCERCGGLAEVQSGTYDFVGSMMTAFRELSRNDIVAFRDIAESVRSGRASSAAASAQIATLDSTLVGVWRWTNENSGALSVLLAVLAIYLSITAGWSSDETAEKLRASVERQTQVEQMMLSELKKLDASSVAQGKSAQTTPQMRVPNRPQTPGPATRPNRHERRKARAKGRRQPPC
jgi:hypothetical protein